MTFSYFDLDNRLSCLGVWLNGRVSTKIVYLLQQALTKDRGQPGQQIDYAVALSSPD